jgi:hypothetical protein
MAAPHGRAPPTGRRWQRTQEKRFLGKENQADF